MASRRATMGRQRLAGLSFFGLDSCYSQSMKTRLVTAAALLTVGGSSAPATGQRPGHLTRPPPARAGAAAASNRVQLGKLPQWPRQGDPHPMRTSQYIDIVVQVDRGMMGETSSRSLTCKYCRRVVGCCILEHPQAFNKRS